MHRFWLKGKSLGRERDEFVTQQEEREGIANPIIMTESQAAGEVWWHARNRNEQKSADFVPLQHDIVEDRTAQLASDAVELPFVQKL